MSCFGSACTSMMRLIASSMSFKECSGSKGVCVGPLYSCLPVRSPMRYSSAHPLERFQPVLK